MKRLSSSDSLGALISICHASDEFERTVDGLEEEGSIVEECGQIGEKKRRLSGEQVKALEKNFEVENKLEPDRKVKLARELGLQPRQVAVWFQNRRARWKTKQLERDYGVLKADYEALKLSFDALQRHNEELRKQILELKTKLQEENAESHLSAGDSPAVPAEETSPGTDQFSLPALSKDLNCKSFNNGGSEEPSVLFPDLKDGSSDSDSSAVLNESYSPSMNHFQFQKAFQYTKMVEEYNFFTGEETCNFFSDEQAPTLHWWN